MNEQADDIILEARSMTKRYPGTIALDGVTLQVHRNQVNVLIGENGAGKSTLMRILAGVETADEGELLLNGTSVSIRSPREAAAIGISIVHQELSILPNLDISENVFAGRELTRAKVLLNRPAEDARTADALKRLHKRITSRTPAAQLSLGTRQVVEIARTIDQGAKVLILDEPTSALSSAETESLFQVLKDLKSSGVTIIYISHRLHELLYLGDWFTVLRSGRLVGQGPRGEVSRQWIVDRMSGREDTEMPEYRSSLAGSPIMSDSPALPVHNSLLTVQGLSLRASSASEVAQPALHDLSFTLQRGEILGIYGLLGAGRTELLETLVGARRMLAGVIALNGVAIEIAAVSDARKHGIVLVPEDRQRDGLIPELSIRENIAIGAMGGFWLSRNEQLARVRTLAKELNIVAKDIELPVTTLSGGNQQKVLIARCLMSNPTVLLLDEPTRGVDVRAKAEIYAILRRLADRGVGVLFTSSEIEETRTLADRALVLCQGRISAELLRGQITEDALFAAASPIMTKTPTAVSGVQLA